MTIEDGHSQGFEQMSSSLRLKSAKYFGGMFEPDEGDIHMLVVVPVRNANLLLQTVENAGQNG